MYTGNYAIQPSIAWPENHDSWPGMNYDIRRDTFDHMELKHAKFRYCSTTRAVHEDHSSTFKVKIYICPLVKTCFQVMQKSMNTKT